MIGVIINRLQDLLQAVGRRSAIAVEGNSALSATRDELLALLMSGKMTVKDAESWVEED